jgi:hypothetical protein
MRLNTPDEKRTVKVSATKFFAGIMKLQMLMVLDTLKLRMG